MTFPISTQFSPPQSIRRGSAFSRKVASKVLVLIERFESLTKIRAQDQDLQSPETTAHVSTFRRLGTSVLKRATMLAEQKAGPQPVKTRPPKRKFLRIPRGRARRHATAKDSNNDHLNNGFGCDGSGSIIDSNNSDIDTSSTSTALVSWTLPSSFFFQLLRSNEHTPTVEPTIEKSNTSRSWGRKKKTTPPRRSIQELRGNAREREPAPIRIKRKTPEDTSVEGLREKFQSAERSFRVITPEELRLREEQSLPRGQSNFREAGSSFGMLSSNYEATRPSKMVHNDRWFYGDSYYDNSMERNNMRSISSYRPTQIVCWDRRYLNTDFKYMLDGSLSSFGYLLRRLELEANTPRPDSEYSDSETSSVNASTFFTAPVPSGLKVKVYRKTPPPNGFFSPENRSIASSSYMERRLEEDLSVRRLSERPAIISPTPLNAVRAAELRGLAFRFS